MTSAVYSGGKAKKKKRENELRHGLLMFNQRTNGHLISGATVSTKTSFAKFDMVLKWVMVNSGSSFI